jgi:hypothetical protein
MNVKQTRPIPGIYNYCDRWCERCSLKHQCSIYDPAELDTLNDGSFYDKMEEILDETLELVKTAVTDENPTLWENKIEDSSILPEPPFSFLLTEHFLTKLGKDYFELSEVWLEIHLGVLLTKEDEFSQKELLGINVLQEGEQITDALEVIQWYLLFVSSKLHRAIGGLRDQFMIDTLGYQNDANGSAKVALIAVERSLTAWETLRTYFPETTDSMLDILVVLSQLRQGIHQVFPNTDKFIRPGFDETSQSKPSSSA